MINTGLLLSYSFTPKDAYSLGFSLWRVGWRSLLCFFSPILSVTLLVTSYLFTMHSPIGFTSTNDPACLQ